MKNSWLIAFLLSMNCVAQQIEIKNQLGEKVKCPLEITIGAPSLDYSKLIDSNYIISTSLNSKEKIIKVHIEGCACLREFYNEYTIEQFSNLKQITIFEDCLRKEYTPRILFGDFNYWLKDSVDHKWFKEYLKEINFENSANNIEIEIQSSEPINKRQKSKILKYTQKISEIFGVEVDRIVLKFSENNYTTRDTDLFFPGQMVNESFIKGQNTKNMRNKAGRFRVVGVVKIVIAN
jgi:hypothetical protein